MKVALNDTVPLYSIVGDAPGVDMPDEFDLETTRYVDDAWVDATTLTTFYVEADGTRQAAPGPGRQVINCTWVDELVKVDGIWVVRDPAEKLQADLLAYAAQKRYAVEINGITVGDAAIKTDRESQAMINGAFALAKDSPEKFPIKFKAAAGFVDIDADTMIAIGRAVATHVQACFATEAEVVAEIEAGTITTTPQIDDAFATL